MEPISLLAGLGLKLKSAAVAAHQSAQMAGLMLDGPPLCTNVAHSELTCADSDMPQQAWCDACKAHA